MKISLIDVDGKMPNIALMKISFYHKAKGDKVEIYDFTLDDDDKKKIDDDTDIIYKSKIFTSTKDINKYPKCKVIKGGTGYSVTSKLPKEIEESELDYSIYPNCDYSLQFLSRGCIRNCKFCLVRDKEGLIHQVKPMNLNPKGKYIKLMDNNFFACSEWRENINILMEYNQPIEFTSGIDLRILTEEQCQALARLKIKQLYCAWDDYDDKDIILKGLRMLIQYIKPYKITCYVLVGYKQKEIIQEDLERVLTIHEMKINPFAMGYIDFNNLSYEKSRSVKDFCRWVNIKSIFKTCKWEDYKSNITKKNKKRRKKRC